MAMDELEPIVISDSVSVESSEECELEFTPTKRPPSPDSSECSR